MSDAPKITGYPQTVPIVVGRDGGHATRLLVDAMVALVFRNVTDVRFYLEGGTFRCAVTCVPTESYGAGHMAAGARRVELALAALRGEQAAQQLQAKPD